jgi:hypothetical protein
MSEQDNNTNQEQVQFPPLILDIMKPFREMNAMARDVSQYWLDEKRDEFYSSYFETFNQVGKNYILETMQILEMLEKAKQMAEQLTRDSAGYGITTAGGIHLVSISDLESILRKKVSKWFHGDGWGS